MFFLNIENYSKKQLKTIAIICNIIYFIVMAIIPTVIVCSRYEIFADVKWNKKITGMGIILIIILGIYAITQLKKVIVKLPQTTYHQQMLKFSLLTIVQLLPLIIMIVAFFVVKEDVDLAFRTMQDLFWCFLVGGFWQGMVLNFIKAEYKIRIDAEYDKAKGKRRSVI